MNDQTNDHAEDGAVPERIAPDVTTLANLAPSAVLPYWESLGYEIDYLCQVGHPDMDRAASEAYLVDLEKQVDAVRRDLVRRARNERTLSIPEEAGSDCQRQARFADLIRARLDLPTFIARHIGLTQVGFRRVGDLLVCACPLPEETNVDAWLWVDPVAQTFHCTGCGAWGDIGDFAHCYFGLRRAALWTFLGREAGLTFNPWSTSD